MRSVLLTCTLLLLPVPASALCRCACVLGQMQSICQQTDLVTPICQGLCTDDLRPASAIRPLAGGQQQLDSVRPFNPAPDGVQQRDTDLNTDTRGFQLGTAGVQSGTSGLSGTASGAAGATGR